MIHWSQNKGHLVVFHGTHIKNVPEILKSGINNKDPKTGMVSVAIGSHGQNIAHGYAAMSGEYGFRQAGQNATTVPHEHRAIVTAHLPMDWVHKNIDRNFGGNPTDVKHRLADPELHTQHVVKTGSDFSPTETPELRFKQAIPAKYIKGWTQKGKKMKSFKEFAEGVGLGFRVWNSTPVLRARADISGAIKDNDPRMSKDEKIERHKAHFKFHRQNAKFWYNLHSKEKMHGDMKGSARSFKVAEYHYKRAARHGQQLSKLGVHDVNNQHEEVTASAIPTNKVSGDAIANPNNKKLFGGKSRFVLKRTKQIRNEPGAT